MNDEFDAVISGEFAADFGAAGAAGVLTPEMADDHIALHVLEGLLQVAACLDCFDYAAQRVSEPVFPIVAEFGLDAWIGAAFTEGVIDTTAPEFPAWMVAVRSIASDLSLACESFLREHRIGRMYFMVHLSNHGWAPLQLSSGLDD